MSDRDEFEKWYVNNFNRRPTGVGYETDICWQTWQAARAQSGRGAEPVAKIVSGYSGDPDTWNDLEIKPLDLSGCKVNDLLYTQPHPAQQGSVPDGWQGAEPENKQ